MSVRVWGKERRGPSSTDAARRSPWRFCMPRLIIGVVVTLTLSVLWGPPLGATEPPARIPRIGLLIPTSAAVAAPALQAFRHALRDLGYVEGQTLALETSFAEGQYDRLAALAVTLVRRPVDVLVAGSPSMIRVATDATTTIPIIGIGVRTGWFTSLTGSAVNLTGIASGGDEVRKTAQTFLEEMIPGLSRVAVLWDAHSGAFRQWGMTLAARLTGIRLQVLEVRGPQEFEPAFAAATREHAEVLIIPGSGLFAMHQSQLAALALQSRLPTLAPFREFAEAGCLLAYGPNAADLFRRAAALVDQLLKGAKPADLPIERPSKFAFVINLKTAQALGLTIPSSLLSQADEVIR
jgi:putative tryptophan/tyrosine transport system substrate-binding protein